MLPHGWGEGEGVLPYGWGEGEGVLQHGWVRGRERVCFHIGG